MIFYREAMLADVPGMAQVRAHDWGTEEYWQERMRLYLTAELHPREALAARIAYVCVDGDRVAGLIAGHLSRRLGCDGELEWVSVRPEYRGQKIASRLFRVLAEWFRTQGAIRICVDVEPANRVARAFYASHGAEDLKPHWMVWKDIRSVEHRA
ncbi:MAG TPA: GNAT family N-acetyltransferase [Verrucomicrobiae bacterium]|jgi:GNAT superfamily N-acetyltransferase|nr:GNAT family N-acetyltransferase [Verrucomicrobiae bacterium]